jgi:hypothetical protein
LSALVSKYLGFGRLLAAALTANAKLTWLRSLRVYLSQLRSGATFRRIKRVVLAKASQVGTRAASCSNEERKACSVFQTVNTA